MSQNTPSPEDGRRFARAVLRDVVLNLVLSGLTGFLGGVFYADGFETPGNPSEAELTALQMGMSFFLGIGSFIAFAISGGWGREPRELRVRRLRVVALVVFFFDMAMRFYALFHDGGSDWKEFPVASVIGAVFGAVAGTVFRCAVGYGLSLLLAKPRKEFAE